MNVGIIGSGIGGACLAHGLRKNGIKVKVYERGSATSSILPGYGIYVDTFGQQAMQECLPETNWLTFKKISKPVGGQTRFYDEHLHLLLEAQRNIHGEDGQIITEDRMSISRSELIEVLNEGLSDTVQWNKTFERYEHMQNGKVRLFFTDKSHEDVDVLIGADGSNSRVRKQYLPAIKRLDIGVTLTVGRVRLTQALADSLPPYLLDGSPNNIVPKSSGGLFVSLWRAPINTQVKATSAEIGDFVMWAYAAATNSYPNTITDFPAESLCDLICTRIAAWDPNLHTLIKQSDMENISVIPLRSMDHLLPWRSSAVTLLGDAIHNMTPMVGMGANTALRDALLLTQTLTRVASDHEDLIKAISDYEQQMRTYANEAVEISLRTALNAADRSMIKRILFRTVLRVAQTLPPIKRVLFPITKSAQHQGKIKLGTTHSLSSTQ
ncbi:FAD-dependent oxidoreductase [Photorhabdus hindustanensis]|uniref:FAD-dependent monooxygenase n=1 Tax=Photorhabdus hindustanensis TaxID=2918802 RepID=A0A2S8PZD2_9GAMM|nr:NAD(P)/FAD-dependent oxidoreductase [Photorhabdus hindustanensis]PQQ24662.1 FAD-dependent monooxygenase [Photorhabdus hindustanensis]